MPGRYVLKVDGEYVGEEVNGRTSECVVGGKESSKVVEGCSLDDVLSSMSLVRLRLPQILRQDCGNFRRMARKGVAVKSARVLRPQVRISEFGVRVELGLEGLND